MSFSNTAISDHEQSEAKRRKLRKGTHSCWECKRRKMRCIFDPGTNSATCNGCQRRSSQCISQEFPPEVSHSKPTMAMDRRPNIGDHVYNASENTTSGKTTPITPSDDDRGAVRNIQTPPSMVLEHTPYPSFYKSFQVRILSSHIVMMIINHLISTPPSIMSSPDPPLEHQARKANMRGCLDSCMKHYPREKIQRRYAKPAVILLFSATR